jgi:DNA-binding PadR family transcriptional regulator
MSGYDIGQTLLMTDAERWSGVLVGSIYHALKKMEQEGHITVASIEQTGHRQKAVYAITEQGKAYLKDLITETITKSTVAYPSSLYAALSFYHKSPKDECRQALVNHKNTLEQEFAAMKHGLEAKSKAMNNNVPPMVQLMMDHMFNVISQQQGFVQKAIELLDSEN